MDPNTKPVLDAKVVLKPIDRRASAVETRYDPAAGAHRARDVPPGVYALEANAKGFAPQAREVRIGPARVQEVVVLGKEGMPFFYRGRVKVPFEPRHNLVAVSLRPSAAPGREAPERKRALTHAEAGARQEPGFEELARSLGLEPEPIPKEAMAEGVRVYRIPGRTGHVERRTLHERLEAHPEVRHVGMVLRIDGESVAFLSRGVVARFAPSVAPAEAAALADRFGFSVQREIPYVPNGYHLRARGVADYDLLEACERLVQTGKVEYAEPDLVATAVDDAVNPTDFLYGEQWHLTLGGGAASAVNFPDAWQALRDANAPGVVLGGPGDNTFGSPGVVVAVMDRGIESVTAGGVTQPRNPDFSGNVTSGQPKILRYYDFVRMAPDNDVPDNDHGVSCAGVAGALANNPSATPGENEGIAGAAPNCRLIGARRPAGGTETNYSDAYVWLAGFNPGSTTPGFPAPVTPGADVITNSFGASTGMPISGLMRDCFDFLTTYGRGGKGVLLFFSAGNGNVDFRLPRPWAAYEKTIAVAASTDGEVRAGYSNFGPGIDVCAPSSGGAEAITTTTLVGTGDLAGRTGGPLDYSSSFGGTSSATPLTAGLGALMLSINPALTWVDARAILRGTAQRIDAANVDPVGQYVDTDGNGVADYSQWYGYGRIRAALAVTTARDYPATRDVLVRDNLADTGVVPSGGAFWNSPDVWVRTASPASDPGAVPASYAAAGPHQTPDASLQNWVYVRLKNLGAQASHPFYVRVYVAHYPGFEFRYPQEFIPSVPPSGAIPSPLVPGTYLLGEQRHDGLAAGAVESLSFEWPSNLVPPKKVTIGGSEVSWHPCLLVEVSPHDGPAAAGPNVWQNNNLAQKNLTIAYPDDDGHFAAAAVVGHPESRAESVEIEIDRSAVPSGVRLYARLADPAATRHLLAAKPLDPRQGPAIDVLELQQDAVWEGTAKEGDEAVLTRYVLPQGSLLKVKRGAPAGAGYSLGQHAGRPVAWLSAKDLARIPVKTGDGRLVPLILGGVVDGDVTPGEYEINLRQVEPGGRTSGGVAIRLVVEKKRKA